MTGQCRNAELPTCTVTFSPLSLKEKGRVSELADDEPPPFLRRDLPARKNKFTDSLAHNNKGLAIVHLKDLNIVQYDKRPRQ